MPKVLASWATVAVLGLCALALLPATVRAQDTKSETTAAPETEQEKKERATRRQCAVDLCSTLHNKKPADGPALVMVIKDATGVDLTPQLSRGS